jgi:hypothetical protein
MNVPLLKSMFEFLERKMVFKLGSAIKVGHQIKTEQGWRKVLSVTEEGVTTKDGLIKFGTTVYGWKAA